MSNNSKSESEVGRGRPRNKVSLPQGKFTFKDLEVLNGVTDENGNELPKGQRRMVSLTLRNWIARDTALGDKSLVVKLEEMGKSEGKGRKPFMFQRRSKWEASQAAKASPKGRGKGRGKGDMTVPVTAVEPSVAVETPVVETPMVETPVVETPVIA
jgi:hypothetical protein